MWPTPGVYPWCSFPLVSLWWKPAARRTFDTTNPEYLQLQRIQGVGMFHASGGTWANKKGPIVVSGVFLGMKYYPVMWDYFLNYCFWIPGKKQPGFNVFRKPLSRWWFPNGKTAAFNNLVWCDIFIIIYNIYPIQSIYSISNLHLVDLYR